ncbi:MAG: hypothetical protein U0521_13275 [Anaerolineae bacterium]
MKIPPTAVIAAEKLTEYLLVPKSRNDKSKFLARAGFTQDNPDKLKSAIRILSDEVEAIQDKMTEYGTSYRVEGDLVGEDGGKLAVVLVWFQCASDGRFYFVTLRPSKGVSGED